MSVAKLAAAGRNQIPLGIAYTAGSTAMFAGGNAVVKLQLAIMRWARSRLDARCPHC